jgi:ABC-type lipoprotein release transport system permease subunit
VREFWCSIKPGDATVLVVTAAKLLAATALASLIPASRAARTDPMVVLSGG